MNKTVKLIVSLTSHSVRIKNINRTVFSILGGTFSDLKVVLTLYKDDVKLITPEIQNLIDGGFIELIVADKDLGPHLKYFYVMQKYRDLPILTIDDDIMYRQTMVEEMYNEYLKHNCVIAQKCFEILHDKNKLIIDFPRWCNFITQRAYPTHMIFATGVGGILYPPNCFKLDDSFIPEILDSKYDDDFYLKDLEVRNDIKIYATKHRYEDLYAKVLDDKETQSIALWNSNIEKSNESLLKFEQTFLKCLSLDHYERNPNFIVSVTSFGTRLNELLPTVIYDMSKQTRRDFKLVITLNREDYDNLNNEFIIHLVNNGYAEVIIADEHYKSHLKYFYAMQKYKNLPIVTIDDDTILPSTAFEELMRSYETYGPDFVHARQAFEIRGFDKPIIGSRTVFMDEAPSHKFCAEGFCGVLYPPNIFGDFYNNQKEIELIKNLITDDDIYLKGLEIRKNVKVKNAFHRTRHMIKQLDLGVEKFEKDSLHAQFNSDEQRMKNFRKIEDELHAIGF